MRRKLHDPGRQAHGLIRAGAPSATTGVPVVSAPGLSNTTALAWPMRSRAVPCLTMIPRRAARLMPAMTAMGLARIRGQRVATTSTATTTSAWRVSR